VFRVSPRSKMEWMLRFSLAILFAAAALAQAPAAAPGRTPPPEVDQALRQRIQEFYDLQVKGEYRKSEAYIAEDTKDWFYALAKPKYNKVELDHIEYNEDFTKATAVMWFERFINAPPFPANVPIRGQAPSTWRLENGVWMWYEDQNAPMRTPFGLINPSPNGGRGVAPPPPGVPGMPGMPGMPGAGASAGMPNLESILGNKVKADQTSVTLTPGRSAQLTFTNEALGAMNLKVAAKPAGVTVDPESAELGPNGKQVLTLKAGKGAKAGVIHVRVEPSGEIIAIKVEVK